MKEREIERSPADIITTEKGRLSEGYLDRAFATFFCQQSPSPVNPNNYALNAGSFWLQVEYRWEQAMCSSRVQKKLWQMPMSYCQRDGQGTAGLALNCQCTEPALFQA